MFVSLNKKFIYTIAIFFLFTALLFIYTFYLVYDKKMEDEQKFIFLRNQQFIEQLYENVNLRKQLANIITENPQIKVPSEIKTKSFSYDSKTEILHDKKKTETAIKNYEARYNALNEAVRIVFSSAILISLSILLLWFLLRRLVISPVHQLAHISNQVRSGNLASRIKLSSQILPDELSNLSVTFNQMLDSLETNIAEIKKQQIFLQSIIDAIPDGIRVIDNDYNIVLANKAYHHMTDNKKEIVGLKCYQSCQNRESPCPAGIIRCPLHELRKTRKNGVKLIQQFAGRPGHHYAINAAPMKIVNGKNAPQFYIIEAISDLSNDIAFSHQQKLSSLGFISTSIAHEMKNNLGSIRMILEGIFNKFYKNLPDDNEVKNYMSLIQQQITESIEIPERLLKLARYSDEKPQAINCYSAISEVSRLLDYEAKRNGTTIKIDHKNVDAQIKGYPADFKMMILNLCLNALKAMPENGLLQISINKLTTRKIEITVSDNGIGISPENLKHIFEPFYSHGHKTDDKSTGLGLAIVKSIVEKSKGQISVESKLGVGTIFRIIFPSFQQK